METSMPVTAPKTEETQIAFPKILFVAQKKFYDEMRNGWNPFRVMWRVAFDTIEDLNDVELATLLATRPQAFGRMIIAEDINCQAGKFKMRSAVVDALVSEVVANIDISGVASDALQQWQDSAPDYLRAKVARILSGPTLSIVCRSDSGTKPGG
jgi:hypothetical protein